LKFALVLGDPLLDLAGLAGRKGRRRGLVDHAAVATSNLDIRAAGEFGVPW